MDSKTGIVFLPLPARGHMVSTVEFAKLLLHTTNVSITILCLHYFVPNPELSSYISSCASTHPDLTFLHLPPLTNPSPPFHLRTQALLSLLFEFYKPLVKSTISTLHSSSPVSALVLDFFGSSMIDVANELGIPPYVFFTSSLAALGLHLRLPTLHLPNDRKAAEMHDHDVDFPGFTNRLSFTAFPDAAAYVHDEAYEWYVHHGRRLRDVKGIVVNSSAEIQPKILAALEEGLYISDHKTPPVYPVGPLLYLPKVETHQCLRWLDEQPCGSVVFLCFGSFGSFSKAQVSEMAIGLERSGHRFLWVLSATMPEPGSFHVAMRSSAEEVLPDGFLERTKKRGLVWPSYAPQGEILGHTAVGGFVTHCGWNSCLESMWFGVPMAAWPLYAEQHLNAFEMVKEMGVAVEVRTERVKGSWATAAEVERAVRCLMGEESGAVREKVKEVKEKARRAVEKGGSSSRSVEKVVEDWRRGAVPPSS